MCQWKNFENWSLIGKDIDKNRVSRFLWPAVYIACTLENTSHFIMSKQYAGTYSHTVQITDSENITPQSASQLVSWLSETQTCTRSFTAYSTLTKTTDGKQWIEQLKATTLEHVNQTPLSRFLSRKLYLIFLHKNYTFVQTNLQIHRFPTFHENIPVKQAANNTATAETASLTMQRPAI